MSNRSLYGIYLLLFIIALGGIVPATYFAIHFGIGILVAAMIIGVPIIVIAAIVQLCRSLYDVIRRIAAEAPWYFIPSIIFTMPICFGILYLIDLHAAAY